jgi:hypothetical protein
MEQQDSIVELQDNKLHSLFCLISNMMSILEIWRSYNIHIESWS